MANTNTGASSKKGNPSLDDAKRPIGYREIYETLWRTRDFELSSFWQRALLLGSFLLLAYAGYGNLCLHGLDDSFTERAQVWFHVLAFGISFFGLIMSFLWVIMMKGSKACYERTEDALTAFRNTENASAFVSPDVQRLSGFGMHWTKEARTSSKPIDKKFFSTHGGAFSVSRVTILIGQLSVIGWGVLLIVHSIFLTLKFQSWLNHNQLLHFFQSRAFTIVVPIILMLLLFVIAYKLLCTYLESSFLKNGGQQ